MWNLKEGYKWTYLHDKNSYKCRKQTEVSGGKKQGRDRLGLTYTHP